MSRVVSGSNMPPCDGTPIIPPLEPGDHLDQPTFHARYEAMPEDVKAELIGGVVFMPAALRRRHGRQHGLLIHWLYLYEEHTPGVEAYDNATTILAEDSEPQPDASLIIKPECGGQVRFTEDDYLQGGPELAAEVASSTESYDLHAKKHDYEMYGVREYIVVALRQQSYSGFPMMEISTRSFVPAATASCDRPSFLGCGSTHRDFSS